MGCGASSAVAPHAAAPALAPAAVDGQKIAVAGDSTASRRSSGAFSVQGEFRPRRSSADDAEDDDDMWGNEQPSHAATHVPSPMQLASRKSSCAA